MTTKETLSKGLTETEQITQSTKQDLVDLSTKIDGIDRTESWVTVESGTARDFRSRLNLTEDEAKTIEMRYQNERGKECYKIPITKKVTGPDSTEYTFKSTIYIEKKDGKYYYAGAKYHNQYQLSEPQKEDPRESSNGKIYINNLVFNVPKENSEVSSFNIERSPIDTEAEYKKNIGTSKYSVRFETGTETDKITQLRQQQEKNFAFEGGISDENTPEKSIYKGLDATAKNIVRNAISLSKNIEEHTVNGKKGYKREIYVEGKPTGKFVEYETTTTGKINTIVPPLDEITILGFTFKNQQTERNPFMNTIDMHVKEEDMEAFKLHYIKQKNMILKSTPFAGQKIPKDFEINRGGSPMTTVNPNMIEDNILNINGLKVPFIMETTEQGEELKLVDLYGRPVTNMSIPGKGNRYTVISLDQYGQIQTADQENESGEQKYEYLSININNTPQTLVGNLNGDNIDFYNPDTQKSIMSCPIIFDEETGYKYNPEGINKIEVQPSHFYKQLDRIIDTTSSNVKGMSKESIHALFDSLFQANRDKIEAAVEDKKGIICDGEFCTLSTKDNIHLNISREKLDPVDEIIKNIQYFYQQIQTIESMKILNEDGEDIRNINAGTSNTTISYSLKDIIKVYEGDEDLIITIDNKDAGIKLAYTSDGKAKKFTLKNTDTELIDTNNGQRKVKMDKNQIKLSLTQQKKQK